MSCKLFQRLIPKLKPNRILKSNLSTVTAPETSQVFNYKVKNIQKTNAALLSNSNEYDYIRSEISTRIIERILDIDKEKPIALDFGANAGQFYTELCNYIKSNPNEKYPLNIQHLYQFDNCKEMLFRDNIKHKEYEKILPTTKIVGEYENMNMFDDNYFDIIITSMSFQWINDVVKSLKECFRVLKPDGCFVGSFTGSGTLQELRSSLLLADQERKGGMGNHISPMIESKDVGNLLSRVGFNLVTIDNETIVIPYPNIFVLMEHLHGSGDQHCSFNRDKFVSKDIFIAAAAIYDNMYIDSNIIDIETRKSLNDAIKNENINIDNENISIDATFNILNFIAWSPHESQRPVLERGSQQHSFSDFDKIVDEKLKLEKEKENQNKNNDNNDDTSK